MLRELISCCRRGVIAASLIAGSAIALMLAGKADARPLFTPADVAAILQLSPLPKLPADPTDHVADNPRAARFGQFFFFDSAFSENGKVSCSSCHQPARAFTDGRPVAVGVGTDTRNAPTLLNAAYNHWFFWDGRVDSQWAQTLGVMENPQEFDSDRLHIAHVVYDNPALRHAYEAIFGPMPRLNDLARFPPHARPDRDHPNTAIGRAWATMTQADQTAVNRVFSNLGKAIEAYERELISQDSRFDRYVAALRTHRVSQQTALSPAALRGLKLFVDTAHCNLCHAGPTFTDGQFHNIGLPVLTGAQADPGRAAGIRIVRQDIFNGIGPFSDDTKGAAKDKLEYLPPPHSQIGSFKTPTLRNIALTAPYFHDGRMNTLKQVVTFYAQGKAASKGQLVGERERLLDVIPHLTPSQIGDLVAFLRTLNGRPLPRSLLVQPSRP